MIEQRRQDALDYQAYLKRVVELARQVSRPESQAAYPPAINTGALRSLFDNLEELVASEVRERKSQYAAAPAAREELALALDRAIRAVKKADWRGNRFKEREVRNAIRAVLGENDELVERIFEIVAAQREY